MRTVAYLALAFAVLGTGHPARADAADASVATDGTGPLYHPDGPGPGRLRVAAGALLDVLPRRIVESEQRTIPRVTAAARYGASYGFSFDARLEAIVIANQLEAGAAWSFRAGDVSVSVGDHVGFWYGVLGVQGFDTTGWGAMSSPGVAVGVPKGTSRFTLSLEAIVLLARHVTLGEASITQRHASLAGGSATLVVETFLSTGGIVYWGAGAIYAEPDYQAWIAFSDSRARLAYPRFVVGYEL